MKLLKLNTIIFFSFVIYQIFNALNKEQRRLANVSTNLSNKRNRSPSTKTPKKKKYGEGTRDLVDEASWESFPASDPPSFY